MKASSSVPLRYSVVIPLSIVYWRVMLFFNDPTIVDPNACIAAWYANRSTREAYSGLPLAVKMQEPFGCFGPTG